MWQRGSGMTNRPSVGILCAGKTPRELACAVHASFRMAESLRVYGFHVGANDSVLLAETREKNERRAKERLTALGEANEAVFTLGCAGFAAGDILPDVTDAVCSRVFWYFSRILCGLQSLPLPASCETPPTDKPLSERIACAASCLAGKAPVSLCDIPDAEPSCADEWMRRFAECHRALGTGREGGAADVAGSPPAIGAPRRLAPSRATAGLRGQTLYLNFSSDATLLAPLLAALMPAVGVAVYALSGKSAADTLMYENELKNNIVQLKITEK